MNLLVFIKDQLLACPSQASCRSWEYYGIAKNVTGTVRTLSCEEAPFLHSPLSLMLFVPLVSLFYSLFFMQGQGKRAYLDC